MIDDVQKLSWSLDGPVESGAAVLLAVIVLTSVIAAWQRLGKRSRPRWAGVASLNLVAGVALLALFAPPAWVRSATDSVVLLTDGAEVGTRPAAHVYVAPGGGDFGRGPEYLLDTGQLPLREPALGAIEVVGHGLDESQWQALPEDLAVTFDPPEVSGIVTSGWQRELREGEPLIITGRYFGGAEESPTRIELVDPAGITVALHDVLASGTGFELITLPKAPGLLNYRIRALRDDDEISSEPVPVHVRVSRRPSLYILQSAPSFETRQLQNWAGDNGASVVIDSVITRGRELRQRINADGLPNDALSPALLRATDLAVVDGRTWAGLSTERQGWFMDAVREGLGLLVFADKEFADYLGSPGSLLEEFTLAARDREADGYFPVWKGTTSEQALPLATLALEFDEGTALTRIVSGEVIEAFRNVGLGRVAVSVLRERHRWLTSGDEATYTAYWSRLMSTIGRAGPLPYILPAASDSWARPDRRSRVCGMTTAETPSIEVTPLKSGDSLKLETAAPATGGPQRCAEFWPWTTGWYRARLSPEGSLDAPVEAFFYVFGDGEWQTQTRYQRQQASAERVSGPGNSPVAATRSARVDVDPLWPWLLFIFSAGLLWLERRLD